MDIVKKIMNEFADSTGLSTAQKAARRYLWTDAFAVCNFLELYRVTGDQTWRRSALNLVDQVHDILGRHREDDPRTGWISGLPEEEAAKHPTIGGLRIGKRLNERKRDEPYEEDLEWDRDGQYYHYLVKWMHALNRVSRSTGKPAFNLWAIELAKTAHAGFVRVLHNGSKEMNWKMSIDLSYPLVPSMGQHDPLDGLVTYLQLQATAAEFPEISYNLGAEIADMAALCKGKSWATNDPLGIGGLLCDAHKAALLIINKSLTDTALLADLLESALLGLDAFTESGSLSLSAGYRLAFRELGMSTGLHAIERIKELVEENPGVFSGDYPFRSQLQHFDRFIPLRKAVEQFWLENRNRNSPTWTDHQDINSVMLATSLAPDGYLAL